MSIDIKDEVKKELAARKARKSLGFDISKYLFKEQLDFVNDQSTYSVASCSRRAGKTEAITYDLMREAVSKDGITALYLTLSRSNAKKLVWTKLLELNRIYKLGAEANATELKLTFPNKSVIYVSGAKDQATVNKFRGLSLSLCYIDEAQSFGSFIKELVDDVITKALYDFNGKLKLTGTPSPVPAGFFFDCCHNKKWSHHAWTMFDNPFLIKKGNKLTVEDLIKQDCERKGCTVDDPSIQRECYGRWITDLNSLVLRYDEKINDYFQLPATKYEWNYIIGVDTGFVDSDSISVIGWVEDNSSAYLIEEIVQDKQGWEALSVQLRAMDAKYKPICTVIDPANGAKKFVDDLNRLFDMSVTIAEKSRKQEFLELLNDSLRSGKFKARKSSRFAEDCQKVEWTYEPKTNKRKVSDRFHSDALDSTLYAFRASQHWLFKPSEIEPQANTQAWFDAEQKRLEQKAIEAYYKKNDPFHFEPGDF